MRVIVFPTHYTLGGSGGIVARGHLYENESVLVIVATVMAPLHFFLHFLKQIEIAAVTPEK